jgi:hypothetical protein
LQWELLMLERKEAWMLNVSHWNVEKNVHIMSGVPA